VNDTATETAEIIETTGEIVPYEPPATALTMFGTSDPAVALHRIATIAGLFVDVVRDRGLVEKIRDREYVTSPGYSVLAGLTGLSPYVAWTRELDDGYHVRVEVRRVTDGTTIAAAEQICSRTESKWAKADKHALLGMATTRAQRRALAGLRACWLHPGLPRRAAGRRHRRARAGRAEALPGTDAADRQPARRA
jgi:hypothetical protein